MRISNGRVNRKLLATTLCSSLLIMTSGGLMAAEDSDDAEKKKSSTKVLLEEVLITARRKDGAESLQDVPLSVTAFNGDQLDAMQFANIADVTASVPNAQADTFGTYPGYLIFTIRGMGVAGTAVSDEPAVGIFIDGVYQGISAGLLLDTFDFDSIEVLRGPQGTLFGRNVTGGAVLMKTSLPTEEFATKARVKYGSFGAVGLAAKVSGPIVDGSLLGKVAVFYNKRDDFIDNINKGNPLAPNADDLGEMDQKIIRGALTWRPSENTEAIFRAEHMESDEDSSPLTNTDGRPLSPAALNAGFGAWSPNGIVAAEFGDWDKTGGDVGAEVPHSEMDSFSMDITWLMGNNSTLQSITGYRDFLQDNMENDFDNSLVPLFEIWEHEITQEQVSQEFLFNITPTDSLSLTTGLYYFQQDVTNDDFRISGGLVGGLGAHIMYALDQTVLGAFASVDYAFTDQFTLTLGGRYTDEEKKAVMSNIGAYAASGGAVGCSADGAPALIYSGINPKDTIDFSSCTPSYEGKADWSNFSPKIGLQYSIP